MGFFGQERNLGVKHLNISDVHLWTPPRNSLIIEQRPREEAGRASHPWAGVRGWQQSWGSRSVRPDRAAGSRGTTPSWELGSTG